MISIIEITYILCAVGFILGLKYLSDPKTAKKGNLIAAAAMGATLLGALFQPMDFAHNNYAWIIMSLVVGSAIGWVSAVRVQMTGMPQMVSLFNGFGGASAMIVGLVEYYISDLNQVTTMGLVVLMSTIFVGAVAFTGSILAYLKLDGKVKDKNVILPKHQWINNILLIICIGLVAAGVGMPSNLIVMLLSIVSLVYGFSFVAPIGGADMPVVISLLNSITGLSAALAGFIYDSQIMILGGVLVGASGTILTLLMCKAMNRSLFEIIAGGFGSANIAAAAATVGGQTAVEATAQDVAIMLNYADNILVVPGYGMAVSQAQKQVKDMEDLLAKKSVNVYYGIHPVAGRMPGHMNVLLAEVDVSYDKQLDLEESNDKMSDIDIVLVIGANDVVNPSALDDPSSTIYGMPVLEVWKAKQVIIFKRSMSSGYAGIDNPLFFKSNSKMLFGDAGQSLKKINSELKEM